MKCMLGFLMMLVLLGLASAQTFAGNVPIFVGRTLARTDSAKKTFILPATATGDFTFSYRTQKYGTIPALTIAVEVSEDTLIYGWFSRTTLAGTSQGDTERVTWTPSYPFTYVNVIIKNAGFFAGDSIKVWLAAQSQTWEP